MNIKSKKDSIDLQKVLAPAGLIILFTVFSVMSPNFFTMSNFMSILLTACVNGVLAIGMTYCVIGGGMDISIGCTMTFAMVMTATFICKFHLPVAIGIILGILSGSFVGLINGLFISRLRISPFIQTIGMMWIAKGMALVVSGTRPIYFDDGWFLKLCTGSVIGNITGIKIPNGFLVLAVITGIAYFLLNKTVFGRYTYAIGSNEEAARLSGVNVKFWKTMAYVMSGTMAGVAAILTCSRLSAAEPSLGSGYEMEAIAACIIGGASPSGGEGSTMGTIIGCFFMVVLINGLRIMSVPAEWQTVVEGAVVIGAVYLDSKRKKE